MKNDNGKIILTCPATSCCYDPDSFSRPENEASHTILKVQDNYLCVFFKSASFHTGLFAESGGVDGSVNRERGKPVVERGKRSVGKRRVGKRRVGKQAPFSSSTSTAGFRRSSQQMLAVRKSPSSAPHSNPHHSLTAAGTHTASDNSEESDSSVDEDSSQTPSAGVAQVAAVDAGPKHIPPTTPTQSSSARAEATVADEDAIKLAPQCLTAPVSTGKKHRYIAFIGNLPFSVTTGDIIAHFRKRGVVASEVRLLTKKNSEESRGCCFAEFQDAKTLQVHYNTCACVHTW